MRGWRAFRATVITVGLLTALQIATPSATFAQSGIVDWSKIMRALNNALNSWRLSPFPRRTPTPMVPTPVPGTPTRVGTSTRTPLPPTRTASSTRTTTSSRTPYNTRPPRPTSTPVPTLSNDGQIAFASA
jgi:hypothetical protein